jgi:putative effector of murein hydrolase LrgA (UPF0299 family)
MNRVSDRDRAPRRPGPARRDRSAQHPPSSDRHPAPRASGTSSANGATGRRRTATGKRHARVVGQVILGIGVLWGLAGVGDLIAGAAGLPVPGSVVGMLLLLGALEARVVRLTWIDDGARLLLAALGLLFVPAGAGFVQFIGAGTLWLKVGAIVVVSALISLAISAHAVQRSMAAHE